MSLTDPKSPDTIPTDPESPVATPPPATKSATAVAEPDEFASATFTGFAAGVRAAKADFDEHGATDLVIGGVSGETDRDELSATDPLEASFAGVYVAVGDVATPVIARRGLRVTADEEGEPAQTLDPPVNLFGGDPSGRGGVRVAGNDLDGDARDDLVAGGGESADGSGAGSPDEQSPPTEPPSAPPEYDAGSADGVFVG